MIYQAYDYIDKYVETLTYIFCRALHNNYSFDYIQERIYKSEMIREFEESNVTLIAFDSYEKNYKSIFGDMDDFNYERNNTLNWIAYAYIYLFINKKITFEFLFLLFPLEKMFEIFPIYHEMGISRLDGLFHEETKHSLLDAIMNKRKITSKKLSEQTGISISTIKALRYNKRDMNKLQYSYVRKIAEVLKIKTDSLFFLNLELD